MEKFYEADMGSGQRATVTEASLCVATTGWFVNKVNTVKELFDPAN